MARNVQSLEFTMFGVRVKARGRLAVWIGGGIAIMVAGTVVAWILGKHSGTVTRPPERAPIPTVEGTRLP